MPDEVSTSPLVLYALIAVTVLSILFGAVNKGTTGFGTWLTSLRRIGSDSRSADLISKDSQITNLAKDLAAERLARQADRRHFDAEMERRDQLARDHIKWDWKVYNVLVIAGLLDSDSAKPPPLN